MPVTATLKESLVLFDGHRAALERGDKGLQARLKTTWVSGRRFVDRGELDALLALAHAAGKPQGPMPPIPNPMTRGELAFFGQAVAVGFVEFGAYMQETVAAGTTLEEMKRHLARAKEALRAWDAANTLKHLKMISAV